MATTVKRGSRNGNSLLIPFPLPYIFSPLNLPGLLTLLILWGIGPLFAQAPTDEWRRGGLDAMVAEPGQAGSILVNPAGIQTQEERHSLKEKKEAPDKPGKKHEWIVELLSVDTTLNKYTWDF
ncbi:MAG: hypothetical protein AAF975_09280, partial [Spirochaetota bacterium]